MPVRHPPLRAGKTLHSDHSAPPRHAPARCPNLRPIRRRRRTCRRAFSRSRTLHRRLRPQRWRAGSRRRPRRHSSPASRRPRPCRLRPLRELRRRRPPARLSRRWQDPRRCSPLHIRRWRHPRLPPLHPPRRLPRRVHPRGSSPTETTPPSAAGVVRPHSPKPSTIAPTSSPTPLSPPKTALSSPPSAIQI